MRLPLESRVRRPRLGCGVGIVGIGLTAHGTERSLDAISTGGICLVIGCLYVWKPNAMERLENGTD
ncbi:hypothetical protein A6E15_16570 [Natrinema saccharevitans]|uniref:Uncharacterized protein n=1 Tax=Natrinema saccharevitans TaxID=301967 RepID=A0A1S8B0U9_9EURY|nr:hypothetical protein A6E15_16570 [Natrinema saccharevitans]